MASLSDAMVRQLLDGRYIASLASQNPDGSIHMVAVWYLFDGTCVYVATAAGSHKARNLQANSNVSIMIDSRDVAASRGTTVVGTAQILTGDPAGRWNKRIHRKYLSAAALADARVGAAFASFDDVTIQITPTSVISWDTRQLDQEVLGGALANNPGYLLPVER